MYANIRSREVMSSFCKEFEDLPKTSPAVKRIPPATAMKWERSEYLRDGELDGSNRQGWVESIKWSHGLLEMLASMCGRCCHWGKETDGRYERWTSTLMTSFVTIMGRHPCVWGAGRPAKVAMVSNSCPAWVPSSHETRLEFELPLLLRFSFCTVHTLTRSWLVGGGSGVARRGVVKNMETFVPTTLITNKVSW